MRVFVSVGTDHHPFDRLVGWASDWARSHPDDDVVIQYGTSNAPAHGRGVELLPRDAMLTEIENAHAVAVSCGPGALMDVRGAGRLPMVVPRRAAAGEHVDDHQLAFARHLSNHEMAICVQDEQGFGAFLASVRDDPSRFRLTPDATDDEGVTRIGELIDGLVRNGRAGPTG